QGWGRLFAFAHSPDHVVPGHDPEVLRRYPPPARDLEGIVVRLDVAPAA
ncbi:MAG TPA: N-acyl homoserine lactonase family protein, partial [Burkholderiales bacterium]